MACAGVHILGAHTIVVTDPTALFHTAFLRACLRGAQQQVASNDASYEGCLYYQSMIPFPIPTYSSTYPRFLQKLLWALPKIIAFSLVAATHYQFLWYMFRVFLPGSRQLCQLSRLVQPSQYADILTQKVRYT